MSKSQLIKKVAEENHLTASNVKLVVEAFLTTLKKETLEKGKVILPGFGTFKKHDSPERMGRNPQTGASVKIPQKTSIKFKQSE